jgi:GT2 family glycosyltransferase
MSRVDVLVVTYNHAATLGATLASLAAQTRPPASVIVLDNASSDRSAEVAREHAGHLPLEVVRFESNRGFAAALNEGLRRSTSEWVLSLNPDCRLEPAYLATLVAAAAEDGRTGAACPLLLRAAGPALETTTTVDSAGMVVSAWGRHADRGAGTRLLPELQEPAWVFGSTGAAALYRRTALQDVAYPDGEVLDERFFAYREDADLAWRLQRRGWRCRFEPRAVGFHARGLKPEVGRSASEVINRLSVRNRFLLLWANADWRWRLACFPFWFMRDLAVVAACLTVERSSLPGLEEAWKLRSIQKQRGRANAARATASGWAVASWFMPWGQTRPLERG